jgi:hypothetical protein
MVFETEVIDESYIWVKIPMKCANGIINDISNLYKYKDENGKYAIGATGGTIDLMKALENAKDKFELEMRCMLINKNIPNEKIKINEPDKEESDKEGVNNYDYIRKLEQRPC